MTDVGISNLLGKCMKLHSIVVCDTSFGVNSVLSLCSGVTNHGSFPVAHLGRKHKSLAFSLQKLHMGGCKGEFYFFHVTLSIELFYCKSFSKKYFSRGCILDRKFTIGTPKKNQENWVLVVFFLRCLLCKKSLQKKRN